MKTKMFEVRDRGTRIAVIAIKTEGETAKESQFFRAIGFDENNVILLRPEDNLASYDPFEWANYRTMSEAHMYIKKHFDELPNYSVVDVRVILKEETEPASSEIWQ